MHIPSVFQTSFIHLILFRYHIFNSGIYIHYDNFIFSISATNIYGQSIYLARLKAILPKYDFQEVKLGICNTSK
jgi:hypothetical protein